jgi:hypothetical protein
MQQNMEQSKSQLRCKHPCVVVSDADDHGHVKVATVSHQHFEGVKTKPANDYAPFEKNPGLGGASISVSPPRTVHVSSLKDATREPKIVKPDKLHKLIKDISTCVFEFELTLPGMYFFSSRQKLFSRSTIDWRLQQQSRTWQSSAWQSGSRSSREQSRLRLADRDSEREAEGKVGIVGPRKEGSRRTRLVSLS